LGPKKKKKETSKKNSLAEKKKGLGGELTFRSKRNKWGSLSMKSIRTLTNGEGKKMERKSSRRGDQGGSTRRGTRGQKKKEEIVQGNRSTHGGGLKKRN